MESLIYNHINKKLRLSIIKLWNNLLKIVKAEWVFSLKLNYFRHIFIALLRDHIRNSNVNNFTMYFIFNLEYTNVLILYLIFIWLYVKNGWFYILNYYWMHEVLWEIFWSSLFIFKIWSNFCPLVQIWSDVKCRNSYI